MGGYDSDGTILYIGRAWHRGDLIPGIVVPKKRVIYICHYFDIITEQQYEVLCGGNMTWINTHGRLPIPHNAVCGGQTQHGERLYIGRVYRGHTLTPGHINPIYEYLEIPFGGRVFRSKEYQLLIEK